MDKNDESPVVESSASGRCPGSLEKPNDEETNDYPGTAQVTLIFSSLLLTVFLVALDATIIATAIPTITSEFGSLSEYSWYNAALLLTTSAFQLPYGRAYTLFNIKWTYIIAIVIFEIGSAICGAAPNSVALIIGRAIAGIGSAGIFSGSFIIIAETIPLSKRAVFSGSLGGVFGIASVVGPLIGGAFTTKVSWRWCFYINLPVGGVVLLIAVICLPRLSPKNPARFENQRWWQILNQFDPVGTIILIPSIVCLLLALQWGGQTYPWNDGRVIALFVVFGVSIIAWIVVQYFQGDNATIPRSIVAQRTVACAALSSAFAGGAFIIIVYNLPVWFQAIKQNNAELSGIHQIPLILSLVISSVSAGGLVVAFGYYTPWLLFGTTMMTIGAGLLSTLTVDSGIGSWLGYQIIFGVGVGSSLEQCNIAVQTVLSKDRIPAGVSLVVFARALGGSIGVSISENVFEQRLRSQLSENLPNLDLSLVTDTSGATDLVSRVSAAVHGDNTVVATVLRLYNRAITDSFYVSVALAGLALVAALGVEWKSVKKAKQKENDV